MGNSFRIASVGIRAHAANTKQCQIYRQTRLTSQSQNHTQGKSPSYYTIAYILKGFSLTHTMPSITEPKPYIRKITQNHNTVEGISQFLNLCHCLSPYITEQLLLLFTFFMCREAVTISVSCKICSASSSAYFTFLFSDIFATLKTAQRVTYVTRISLFSESSCTKWPSVFLFIVSKI